RSLPIGVGVLDPVALVVEAVAFAVRLDVRVERVGPPQLLLTGARPGVAVPGRPRGLPLEPLRLGGALVGLGTNSSGFSLGRCRGRFLLAQLHVMVGCRGPAVGGPAAAG